jgi:autotransporter-associated beta strand protein
MRLLALFSPPFGRVYAAACIFYVLGSLTASAQADTWLGTTSTDWLTGTNWDGGVPASNSTVVIDVSGGNMPSLLGETGLSAGIYIGQNSGSNSTLTLQSGALLTSSGTGEIGYAAGALGAVSVSNATWTFNNNAVLYVGDAGTGNLSITNGGQVTSNSATIGSSVGALGNVTVSGAASVWTNNGDLVLGDSGTGNLTIAGGLVTVSGNLDLANAAGSHGTLNLNGGALQIGGANGLQNLGGAAAVNLGGGTLQVISPGGWTSTVNATLVSATNSTIDTNGLAAEWDAVFSGSGGLTKTGAGVLTLDGNNSTYTGVTTLNAGTLSVGTLANGGSNSSIGAATNNAANLVINGGTLQYTGAGNSTTRLFTLGTNGGTLDASGTGNLTFGNATAVVFTGTNAARTLTLTGTNTGANTFSPIISNNGTGLTSVIKSGSGEWVLNTASTFSGGTTINAGTLALGVNTALLNTGNLTINGGTFGLVTFAQTLGNVTLASGNITSTTGTLTVNTPGSIAVQSGNISAILAGTGNVTKSTAGTVTLSGVNTFTGGVVLNAGTLDINGTKALGGATGNFTLGADGVTFDNTSGATVTMAINNPETWNGNFTFAGSNALSMGTGAITLGGNRTVTINASTLTLGGVIGDAGHAYSLTKAGAGTLTLSAANTFTGGTTINAGTLALGVNTALLNTGNLTINGGTFSLVAFAQTLGNVTLVNGSITSTTGTLTVNTPGSIAAQNGTISAILAGTGNVTKSTAGTVTLSGVNSFTGGVILNAGTLDINNAKALGGAAGNFTLGADGVTFDNNSAAAITMTNANPEIWNGNATFTGTQSLALIGAITLGGNRTLTTNANTLTLSGAIGDGGNVYSLTKAGAGTLTLSGASTFSGGTTVNAGTLALGVSTALLNTGNLTINGGTFSLVTFNQTLGNVTLVNGSITSTTGTLTVNTPGSIAVQNGTISAILAGTGNVTKSTVGSVALSGVDSFTGGVILNAGTLTLSGANTFTGGVILNAGTLDINNAKALGGATSNFTLGADGVTFDNNSAAAITMTNANPEIWNGNATFTGTQSLALIGAITLGGNRTLTTSANVLTLSGAIGDSGNAYSLTKGGAGTLLLSGANTFTGGLTFNAGTLDINNAKALGGAAGTFTIAADGLTLDNNSAAAITMTNANPETWNGNFTFTGTKSLGLIGPITLGGNRTITDSASVLALSGVIDDGGNVYSLTKGGAGTLQLSGANTFTGGVTFNAGILDINNAKALGGANGTFTIAVDGLTLDNNSAAAITMTNANPVAWNGNFTFTGTQSLGLIGPVTLGGNRTVTTSASTLTLSGAIGDGGSAYNLTKAGAGALALAGANTFTGGVTLNAGILDINNATALGGATGVLTIAANGVTLNNTAAAITMTNANPEAWNGNFTFTGTQSLGLIGPITLGGNRTITTSGNVLTLSGVINDGGSTYSLTKAGAGTLQLSGANTFTGGVTLNAGILDINNATALGGATGPFTIGAAGVTLDNNSAAAITMTNANPETWNGNFTFTGTKSLGLIGPITLGGNRTVTDNANVLTLSGIIGDGGNGYSLIKAGAGTLALNAANTFTGGVTLSAGILDIGNATALGGAAGTFTITAGTFDNLSGGALALTNNNPLAWNGSFTFTGTNSLNLGTGAVTLNANPTVTVTANTLTVGGIISGANTLTKAGAGTLVLNGANNFTGGVTLTAGILDIGNATALGTGAGTFTITAGTIDNLSGGPLSLTNNNPLAWNGSFTFTGTNALNLGTGAVTLNANPTVTVTANTLTVGGNISGAHSLTKAGAAGTLVLSGVNNFSAGVSLTAGTLDINSATALGTSAGTFALTAGVTFDNTSGAALTLTNNNPQTWNSFTFTGTNDLNLGTGNVTLGAGTDTVTVTAGNLTVGGIVSAANALTKTGAGTLILSNANSTYNGITTVNLGTLSVSTLALGGSNSSIGVSTNAATKLVINNDAVLQYTGTGASTDRLFTIGTTGAALDASGTGGLLFTNAGAIAFTTLNVAHTLVLTGNNTNSNTFTPVVGNAGTGLTAVTKSGPGLWLLAGTNTYTGLTTISGGTLSVGTLANGGANSNIGASTNAAANLVIDGGTLQYTGATIATNRSFTLGLGNGTLDASGTGTLTYNNAAAFAFTTTNAPHTLTLAGGNTGANTLAAPVKDDGTGSTALAKSGAGQWVLTGSGNYTGGTTVLAGTLTLGVSNITTNAGNVNVSGGTLALSSFNQVASNVTLTSGNISGTSGQLSVNSPGGTYDLQNGTVSAILAGSGNLTKDTGGTVILSGANTYSGVTNVNAGTLQTNGTLVSTTFNLLGGNLSLGASSRLPTTANVTVDNGGALNLSSFNQSLANLTLTNGTIVGSGTLTSSNDFALLTGNVSVVLAGPVGVTKTGVGSVTLSGANDYTGPTTISAGTLALAGSGSLGSGNVTFGASGGTLDVSGLSSNYTLSQVVTGNGTINTGSNTLLLTGVISPGVSGPGTISVNGSLSLSGNTNLGIYGSTAGEYDQFAVAIGTLTLGGTLNISTNYPAAYGDTVQLFNATTITGSFPTINGVFLSPYRWWDVSQLGVNGTITVVPESAVGSLAFGGLVLLLAARRRRKTV